jgi:hypothetical protein
MACSPPIYGYLSRGRYPASFGVPMTLVPFLTRGQLKVPPLHEEQYEAISWNDPF